MGEISQQLPRTAKALTDLELRYYYFGFYKTLKRYRATTLIGWGVVTVGCVGFFVGWGVGRPTGIMEIALSSATVLAGLVLVSQNIACLERYVRIALPAGHNGERISPVQEILEIMKDVDEGGWQEARTAIRKLLEMEKTFGLPPLE